MINLFRKKPREVVNEASGKKSGILTDEEIKYRLARERADELKRERKKSVEEGVRELFSGHPSLAVGAQDSSSGLIPDFKANQYGAPPAIVDWYISQGYIGYQVSAMMSQHWLVDKACLMPARDAIRLGYEFSLPDEVDGSDEIITALKKMDRKYNIKGSLKEYIHFGRIFGVRVALFVVDHPDGSAYYERPFNIDGIEKGMYKGISQIDPLWLVPELDSSVALDPASIGFYEPEYYVVGGQRYHKSHLCIYVPYPVPDSIKPRYMYAGKSLPQMIYERVYAAERTANESPLLVMTKRLNVLKTDSESFFSNIWEGMQRIADWVQTRDNQGVLVVDKESEDVTQSDTGLADLDAVIMNQYQLVAAIAEVPATKLLGTSPKGFNATGEAEAEDYRIMLESIQSCDMQPMLERHYQLVWASDLKHKFGGHDLEIDISWHPLDSPTAQEWADINLKKAQAAQTYAGLGAIDGYDVREQMRKDKNSDFFGLDEHEVIAPDEPDELTNEV